MTQPVEDAEPAKAATRDPLLQVERDVLAVVRGNPEAVRLALAAILAGGHVLLEGVPGLAKTLAVKTLAQAVSASFRRIQFTADLLPSDVLGVQILEAATGSLRFKRGPIFAHLVLADEINRASPKTQSALLEAMADGQISVDDETHPLPPPFCVLATQNPVEHHGAYPLPESQLDRFLLCLSLGYPPAEDERALLVQNKSADDALRTLSARLDPAGLLRLQAAARAVTLSDAVAQYLLAIVEGTRRHAGLELGCSPRGALAWGSLARARAFLDGRAFVLPDDVKATAHAVLVHRIAPRGMPEGAEARRRARDVVAELLTRTPAPR